MQCCAPEGTASGLLPPEQTAVRGSVRHPCAPTGINLYPIPLQGTLTGWTDYVAIVDASVHRVGIVVVGEVSPCDLTVAQIEWPGDIKASIMSENNPNGTITNSDLQTAGALLVWLVVEGVCPPGTHVAIYSDNEATVNRMVKRKSRARIVAHLTRAVSLCLKFRQSSLLSPLHIPGKQNLITDVLPRTFGSVPSWRWKKHHDFQTNFNSMFPLLSQHSWAVFVPSCAIFMRMVCVLRMHASMLDAWRRLPRMVGHWGHWTRFVWPLGVDPYLALTPFKEQVRILTAFTGLVRVGVFCHG